MKRIQIDLPENVHSAMIEQAAQHGHRLKPFLEFIISVQAGHVPPPQIQPIKVSPTKDTPEKVKPAQAQPERSPEQVQPSKVDHLRDLLKPSTQIAPEKAEQKRQPKTWTPNKNLLAYTEETDTGSGIFTDGKSFAVQTGPAGRQKAHFFEYLHEAEEFMSEEAF